MKLGHQKVKHIVRIDILQLILISVVQYFFWVFIAIFHYSFLVLVGYSLFIIPLKGVYCFIHYSPDIAVLIIIPTFPNQNIHYSPFFYPVNH